MYIYIYQLLTLKSYVMAQIKPNQFVEKKTKKNCFAYQYDDTEKTAFLLFCMYGNLHLDWSDPDFYFFIDCNKTGGFVEIKKGDYLLVKDEVKFIYPKRSIEEGFLQIIEKGSVAVISKKVFEYDYMPA